MLDWLRLARHQAVDSYLPDSDTALLPVFESVLGPEHPNTLTTRHAAAAWTGEARDAANASGFKGKRLRAGLVSSCAV